MPTIAVTPEQFGDELCISVADVQIPAALLTSLAPIDATARAVKLQDARVSCKLVPNGATTPVVYTIALTVMREPVNETESAKIATAAASQKTRKAERDAADQVTRDREVKRAIEMTKSTVLDVMRDAARGRELANKLGI